MKVKMFTFRVTAKSQGLFKAPVIDSGDETEAAVNAWLADRPNIRVHHVKQTVATVGPPFLLITLWYDEPAGG